MSALIPPAIRYLGSKFLCAEWIISHFPPHRAYCEPCGGAAAVLLMAIILAAVFLTQAVLEHKKEDV